MVARIGSVKRSPMFCGRSKRRPYGEGRKGNPFPRGSSCSLFPLQALLPEKPHRSSRKYASPRLAGGWFSRLLRMLVMISTTIVTT